MKKWIAILAAAMLLSGCAAAEPTPTVTTAPTTEPTVVTTGPTTAPTEGKEREDTHLAVLLPEEESWGAAGEDLQMLLQNYHYQVSLFYGENDGREQALQLEQALTEADGVILAPVESAALTEACLLAQEQEIPVFSYDRLLMDTEAVGYHVSFDYRKMGAAIGRQLVAASGLADMTEGEVTAEFFMGSPEDSSGLLLYLGIMDELQPYLDQGLLVSRSGRIAFEDTCVQDWDKEAVAQRLTECMTEYYKGGAPDIICTVSDDFAAACLETLSQKKLKTQPLITAIGGQDWAREAAMEGKLLMTVATDLYQLNEKLVETVDAVMTGKEPLLNDLESCDNNATVVPAYLCDFEVITAVAEETQPTEPAATTEPA